MGICSYKIPIIIPDSRIQVVIPKYNELNQTPIIQVVIPKYNELNQSPIIPVVIPKYNELNQTPIIPDSRIIQVVIPKYNVLNQSPPICFNKNCMLVDLKVKQCQSPSINKNKHCINKHITQCERFDEYYYNKYMNSPNN